MRDADLQGEGARLEVESVTRGRKKQHIDFVANINGRSVHFSEGEAEMPADVVNEYQRAGFVSIFNPEPKVKIVNKPKNKANKAVK